MGQVKRIARWQTIADQLRSAIVSHQLEPGMRLAEDELARIYDVSRTVVRSALQALIHEQLVTHIPNKGVTISKPSRFEAREVFSSVKRS